MCGIAGLLDMKGRPAERAVLARMARALAHRGPDGEGVHVAGALGVSHRRLAIIDLSDAAAQPFQSADGQWTLAYNGEIYNYRDLRRTLEAEGVGFRTRSDTEVVLAALARWGTEALSRFNGMFALILCHHPSGSLLLARDRYGTKPLYHAEADGVFAAASEVKALLAVPGMTAAMDAQGLAEYLTFQNFLGERTLFAGIRTLAPGTWMKVERDGRRTTRRYWDYAFQEPERPAGDEAYLEEMSGLFRQAVGRQLVADVEVGTFLSGGMDSGSIAMEAAGQLPYLKSFTCGFDLRSASGMELNFDERPTAEYMSYLFRTEHYEVVLKAGDMERVLDDVAWHLEEPRVGQSYPNFFAAKLASRFVKVALAGTGGDELFGGYPWRYYRAVANRNFDAYVDTYYRYWQRLIPEETLPEVMAPVWKDAAGFEGRDIFRSVFTSHAHRLTRPEDYVNHSLYFEAKTFLQGLLMVEDKLGMAHGLETRFPFLDNDLVDFAMRLPVRCKLGRLDEVVRFDENEPGAKSAKYYQRTNDGKLLLRRMLEQSLPADVAQREKQGFSAPDASWFKGDSINFVRRVLADPASPLYTYLDFKAVKPLVAEHMEGRANRRLLIWSLLNIDACCRKYFAGPPA